MRLKVEKACNDIDVLIGTLDVDEDVYTNDDDLVDALIRAGYLDSDEADALLEDGDDEEETYVWSGESDRLLLILKPDTPV